MSEELLVLCAWCGVYLRGDKQGTRISHGICKSCADREFKDDVIVTEKNTPLDKGSNFR